MNKLFGRLPVAAKIAIAPAFAVLCLCAVAMVVFHGNARSRQSIEALEHVRFPAYERAVEIEQAIDALNAMVYQSIAWQGAGVKQAVIDKLDAGIADRFKATERLLAPPAGAEGDDELAGLRPLFAKFRKGCADTLDMKAADLGAAAGFITTIESDYGAMKQRLRAAVAAKRTATLDDFAQSQQVAAAGDRVLQVALALSLLVCGGVTLFAVRAISLPLRRAAEVAAQVSQGDLTARVDTGHADETGRMLAALSSVTQGLSGIVADIRGSAQTIDAASAEIAHGHEDLSRRTERQAADLQQTASAIEQLTCSVRQNAGSADEARAQVATASAVAADGGAAMDGVVSTMERINGQARRIAEIIGTIDGIAFQTNILALNAAVEAARAGEQGRGFAVVASEVRALAGRSGTAAKEIRALIDASAGQVEEGSRKVEAARLGMQRIVQAIGGVEQTVGAIATACAEQASGVESVNQAVANIDQATQQNAALVEQATAAAASLRTQAGRLVQSMAVFRTREAA